MKKELVITVLTSWVGLIWCSYVPERPAYNFGETYRVYGDTKECMAGSSGTKCRWYQTQYFQMLPDRKLRIDTNVKNVFESFFYFASKNGIFRYHYVPSNWRTPCTVKEVSRMPIQRVPISFTFNGTDTVEWKTCNLWRRDTGYNPVTTETWCIRYNNDVYPPTTEPLSFTLKRTNLTRETLWRGYTTSVAKWYFNLPYQCPPPPPPPEDNTDNGSDNHRNESNNTRNTEGNNMKGLTTTEPMETTMATKMTVTTKMQNVTTTAVETKAETDDTYKDDNSGYGPTSTTTSMMKEKMTTVTMATSDYDEDPYENDNKGNNTTTPPKHMKTTKMKTVTIATRPTTADKTKAETDDKYENNNNGHGSTSTTTSMMKGKMATVTMATSDNDEDPYENDNKGKNTTKTDGYDDHYKEEKQTTSATTATKLETTTLPSMRTMTRNDNDENENEDEDEDEDEDSTNSLFSNS